MGRDRVRSVTGSVLIYTTLKIRIKNIFNIWNCLEKSQGKFIEFSLGHLMRMNCSVIKSKQMHHCQCQGQHWIPSPLPFSRIVP